MTPLPSFPVAGQAIVLPPGCQAAAETTGIENAPFAEGETPAAFACMLQLCTEPAPAPVLPPAPAPADRAVIDPPAPALVTTARSLGLELPDAPAETAESEEEQFTEVIPLDEESDFPAEVPAEILSLGVNLPVSAPAPQPMVSAGPARGKVSGPEREISVVDKQIQSDNGTTPLPARPVIATPAVVPPVAPAASVAPEQTVASALSGVESTPPVNPDRILPAVAKNHVETPSSVPLEKIAVPVRTIGERPVVSASKSPEYKFLKSDNQSDTLSSKQHGTVNAKSSVDMQTPSESTPFPFASAQSRAGEPAPGVEIVNVTPSAVFAATPSASTPSEVTVRREISLPTADAAAVVREVAELTHDFRFHERSSVEVKFNFKDDTELSVRLAYRDGDVHATFRTDSTGLRDTLGREWQGYAAQVAQETRGYRMADPVFTSSGDFSGSPQGRDSGSATGGDARNQQPFSNPDQSGSRHTASPAHGFRPPAAASSVSPSAPGPRVSTDRLLHAFA